MTEKANVQNKNINTDSNKQGKLLYCSFCGKSQHEVRKLISGPSVFICDECINLCNDVIIEELGNNNKKEGNIHCSFCNKEKTNVTKLVEGAGGYICNECIEESVNILKNEGHNFSFDENKIYQLEKLGIKPAFNKTDFILINNHCFYLCPFKEPFDTIYSDHIKPAIQSIGFTVERADEIYGVGNVMEDVWEGINKATIILADVTTKNPNVLYEAGIAHTVGKPVIIIAQSIDDIPFDLRHRRSILYSYTPRGCKLLEDKIKNTLNILKI